MKAGAGSSVSAGFWSGRRVFVTGHTGFKGSWLCAWLLELGAEVRGYSLEPETSPNMFSLLGLDRRLDHVVGDVRDPGRLRTALSEFRPSVVFHLAAQPLVRRSYAEPAETLATNVMGTAHILDATRHCDAVEVCINVTSDKCYENREWIWGYRETDAMGGHDPYSASKGCAEIVTAAYRSSFFHAEGAAQIASARAGNVVGGGDWSEDRLIPDAIRAFGNEQVLEIRNPAATRPWQHVLEPLRGYMLLAEACHAKPGRYSRAWNFGPSDAEVLTVGEVIEAFREAWGETARWHSPPSEAGPHEANLLKLDCSQAIRELDWAPRIPLRECLELTAEWYKLALTNTSGDALWNMTLEQIQRQ